MKKDFDPRFGKHDPRETPLGRATKALLEKMHKQQHSDPKSTSGNNKSKKS